MTSSHVASKLSRQEKLRIGRQIYQNLQDRAAQGPSEPPLDGFLPPLALLLTALDKNVIGKTTSEASRAESADVLELADVEVDTCLRNIENYLDVQRRKPHSPHAISASTLYAATFPQGLRIVDKRIPEENIEARGILNALQTPEHQSSLAKMKFPMAWLDDLSAALDASEKAYAERNAARLGRGEHVKLGKDAEAEWVDLIVRLKKYLDARAPHGDIESKLEAERLLEPLTTALATAKAVAMARKTRKNTEKAADTAPRGA